MNQNDQIILIIFIIFVGLFSTGSYLYSLPNLQNLKPINYITVLIIFGVGVGSYFLVDKIVNDSNTTSTCPTVSCTNDIPCNCGPHGFCDLRTGKCQCLNNWTGLACENPPPCPDNCNGIGKCKDGVCDCSGTNFTGVNCSILKDKKPCPDDSKCSGNGTCDPVTGKCICKDGYNGIDCKNKNLTCGKDSTCGGNGLCNVENGRCACNSGYYGDDCENISSNFSRGGFIMFIVFMVITGIVVLGTAIYLFSNFKIVRKTSAPVTPPIGMVDASSRL